MPSATLELGVPLHNTMGAMFIGVIISAVLHGITLVQAYYYFSMYHKDTWYMKTLVVILVLFDATHLAFITHTIYHYLITDYYDHKSLQYLVWSVLMEALFTGLNGAFVQCFYTLRVWRLSNKNWLLTGFILLLVVANGCCGTAWVIISMRLRTYQELLDITPLTNSINALSTTIDVVIAGSLVILLHRVRTGFKKSDTMINRLIIFVVNTGVLTSICAIAALISLVVSPRTLIYAAFYFCIGRLYTNSFLATLNARKSIADRIDEGHTLVSLPPSVLTGSSMHKSQPQNISIRIDTCTTEEGLEGSQKSPAPRQGQVKPDDGSDEVLPIPKAHAL
ncbi:hypothetical protein AMATHDRAFT_69282 [Amanita thiersii Skay4041]|uniref:DUF6534 domain-containing protein n=1 Tax=Amanita thiersii Skay4041 TaxID=703135 RepID=A0A2A9N9J4_9AGAR|nr:hypothetical protein AMATHDRAFT_69282 [Amanita thiersii Skay4041]